MEQSTPSKHPVFSEQITTRGLGLNKQQLNGFTSVQFDILVFDKSKEPKNFYVQRRL